MEIKQITRITADILKDFLDEYKIRHENKRVLTGNEKEILFEELSNYFIAVIYRFVATFKIFFISDLHFS